VCWVLWTGRGWCDRWRKNENSIISMGQMDVCVGCLVLCCQKKNMPYPSTTSQDRDPHIENTRISRAPSSILGPRVSASMLGRPLSIMGRFQNGVQHICWYPIHHHSSFDTGRRFSSSIETGTFSFQNRHCV
jgi:hypothetical protein